jgi:hypothetical protein
VAFRIVPSPTFRVKVPLTVPGAESRGVVEIEFRHKGRAAFVSWWESMDGRKDAEILAEIIAGWSDVIDDHGNEVAYSDEALALLVDRFPSSALELQGAYRRALWEAREKN